MVKYQEKHESLRFKVIGRKRGQNYIIKANSGQGMKVGMSIEDAHCETKWKVCVNEIDIGLRVIRSPSLVGDTTGFQTLLSVYFI